GPAQSVHLADLDGDGDLDVFIAEESGGAAWFNDGGGQLTAASQRIKYGRDAAVTVGDIEGDGLVDVLVVGLGYLQLWRNDGSGLFTADARSIYRVRNPSNSPSIQK
ncbi:MAG TPA: VCBS repeat-containing protein, partial [Anaerolineales bacterium]